MPYTDRLSEKLAVVGKIAPQNLSAGTATTDVIDLMNVRRVLFIVSTGTLTASNTTDFKIRGCATSGGSYADIDTTNAAITQLTQAGGDSNKIVLLEVRAEKIAALNLGYRYILGSLTTAAAAGYVSVVALAAVGRNKAESKANLAAVKQIVVY